MLLNPWIATRNGKRVYNDMATSQWWYNTQQEVRDTAVILGLMLFSNQTLVSTNARQKAWPLYCTLSNIPKSIRYQQAYRACRVVAFLPVITVRGGIPRPVWWSHSKILIFQYCMQTIISEITSEKKHMLFGPKGKIYPCIPALASYSVDYAEQCLLARTKSWLCDFGCHRCTLERKWFRYGNNHPVAEKRNNANMTTCSGTGEMGTMLIQNASHVDNNEYFNIYESMVIDDLHQIGGVYKHLLCLVENKVKKKNRDPGIIDLCYQQLPRFRGVKYSQGGYLLKSLTNPTYHELRYDMSHLLTVVHDLITSQVSLCIRSFLNFFTQIISKEHSDETIAEADRFLNLFYYYSPIFESSSESSLNFPKIHMLTKYSSDILNKGPLDGYSTCHSEHLHKTSAKQPSKRTNRHTKTFTRSLSKIIKDREAFIDLYPVTLFSDIPMPPHASLQPLDLPVVLFNERQASYNLQRLWNDDNNDSFESIKTSTPELKTLHSVIRMYLDTVINDNHNRVRVANAPMINNDVKVYKELKIIDYDDDGEEETEATRQDEYAVCSCGNEYVYTQVYFFIEVALENNETYSLCVGTLYKDQNEPHAMGYKFLQLLESESFVCSIESVENRTHIVPCFNPAGLFLLNHDINRRCWAANDNPQFPELLDYADWKGNLADLSSSNQLQENDFVAEVEEIEEETDEGAELNDGSLEDYAIFMGLEDTSEDSR